MSGHYKWATTKHKKALIDSRRSRTFSKLSNSIAIAARGGKDPNNNPGLRDAIIKARAANMPSENIDRAVKRGSGEIPGVSVIEYLAEAYGPNSTAFLIRIITDNKNRTLGSLKNILHEQNSRLAEPGSVQWMFSEIVCLEINRALWQAHQDLELPLIDAGAEEIIEQDGLILITCAKTSAEKVKTVLHQAKVLFTLSVKYFAANPIIISYQTTKDTIRRLIERLEENDEIDSVYSNVSFA